MEKTQCSAMRRGLKNRHLQMIALGGAIGTGLFYGSAPTIQLAGPAIVLSYLIGGIVIYFIMRMLGEMAVEEPVSGSFSHYANRYWGEFPGFLSGWNYWANYVIVSMAELTAVGIYVNYWLPDAPQWLSALVCLVVITAANLINVRLYGELEFYTAIIKVVAISGMIVFGFYLIFARMNADFGNLWMYGGFMPNGAWGVMMSLVVVMFSFGGIELIGITAGEADDPQRTIPRAINQVLWRILIFYIGTLFVLMTLYPWNKVGMESSPFVQIFSNIGIPAAANLLNVVVLTAALSVYNSAIYSNSRMLYGLALQGNAPRIFTKLLANGVPAVGILVSSGFTLVVVAMNYFMPGKVFMYLISIAVAAVVVSWVVIVATHLKFRRTMERTAVEAHYKAPGYPYINYFCLVFLLAILCCMTLLDDMRLAVCILPVWLFALWGGFQIKKRMQGEK